MREQPFYQHTHDLYQTSVRTEQVNQPAFDFGWHYHDCCEVTFVETGDGRLLAGDNATEFNASSLFLLPPQIPHAFISLAGSSLSRPWVVQFDPVWLSSLLVLPEFFAVKNLFQNTQHGTHFFQSPLTTADFLKLQQSTGVEQINLCLTLIAKLAASENYQIIGGALSQQPVKNKVSRICAYIDSHLKDRLSHQTIANEFAVSSSHLARLFKQTIGYSLTDYIIRRRMQRAAQLLTETDWQITQIADYCGYQQVAFFTRTFRRVYNLTPSAYRHFEHNKP